MPHLPGSYLELLSRLDYVVVKIPRWAFEKFPGVDPTLGPQMKSVGEVKAIGRTFKEAFNKGFRSLEIGYSGWHGRKRGGDEAKEDARGEIEHLLRWPNHDRLQAVHDALWQGWSEEEVCRLSQFDPWFVQQLPQIVALEKTLAGQDLASLTPAVLWKAKRYGLSDARIAELISAVATGVGATGRSPLRGVIVQFGGQTPLNLSKSLAAAGVPILGTTPDAIDLAEDRGRFGALLAALEIPCPANGIAHSLAAAKAIFRQIGYPVVVRPSYVLGGRAMAIVSTEAMLGGC